MPTDTLYIGILTLHTLFFSHSKTNLAKLGAPHPTPQMCCNDIMYSLRTFYITSHFVLSLLNLIKSIETIVTSIIINKFY